ncbi:MAG: septum formation initiator family protein [Kiritimatiellae bacterium]|nr:septum formation initiator family protein [Kiritimatiellia bacterium]
MAASYKKRKGPDGVRRTSWDLVYRFSWVGIALLFVAGTVCFFVPQIRRCVSLQRQIAWEREEVKSVEAKIKDLKLKQIRVYSDPDFLEQIAREELGWTKPGETVFRFPRHRSEASGH